MKNITDTAREFEYDAKSKKRLIGANELTELIEIFKKYLSTKNEEVSRETKTGGPLEEEPERDVWDSDYEVE